MGYPEFITACQTGDLATVHREITYNHHDLRQSDENGYTPLHVASSNGRLEVVQAILSRSDPDQKSNIGWTALMFASENGYSNVVDLLIPVSRVRHIAQGGDNALTRATFNGHLKVAKILIPLSDLDHQDEDGNTAKMYAEQFPHILQAFNEHERLIERQILHETISNEALPKLTRPRL